MNLDNIIVRKNLVMRLALMLTMFLVVAGIIRIIRRPNN